MFSKFFSMINLNDKMIEQEMNKMAIHTHVIFRPHIAMFFLSNTWLATMTSLLSYKVNSALVNRAQFR